MNRYFMIRRLMGPAILLLLGTLALLHQLGIASWHYFFPLLLILIGIIKLAERAALSSEPNPDYLGQQYPAGGYPPYPYPGAPYQQQPPVAPQPPAQQAAPSNPGSTIVPTGASTLFRSDDDGKER